MAKSVGEETETFVQLLAATTREETETDRCTHLSLKEREEGFFGERSTNFPPLFLLFLFAAAKTALVQW